MCFNGSLCSPMSGSHEAGRSFFPLSSARRCVWSALLEQLFQAAHTNIHEIFFMSVHHPKLLGELISHTQLNPLRKTQTAASRVYETRCSNDPMCYIIILHHVDTACGIYIHMSQVMDDTSRASERIRKTQLHLSASIHSFIYF